MQPVCPLMFFQYRISKEVEVQCLTEEEERGSIQEIGSRESSGEEQLVEGSRLLTETYLIQRL